MNPNLTTQPSPMQAGSAMPQPKVHPQELAAQGHDLLTRAEADKAMLREEINQRDMIIQDLVTRLNNFVNS